MIRYRAVTVSIRIGSGAFHSLPGQLHGRLPDVLHQVGGGREPHLPGHGAELGVPQGHATRRRSTAPAAAAGMATLSDSTARPALYLLPAGEVFGEGGAVSHGFHRLLLARRGRTGLLVQSVGVLVELETQLSQQRLQHLGGAGRQLADGLHAVLVQHLSGRRRPTNSRSPTGRGQTMSCQFSRVMTVVASGFL